MANPLLLAAAVAVVLVALVASWLRRARDDAALAEPPPPPRIVPRALAAVLLAGQLPFLVLIHYGNETRGPFAGAPAVVAILAFPLSAALTLFAVALSFASTPRARRTKVEAAWPVAVFLSILCLVPAFAIGGCYAVLGVFRQ